MKSVNETVTQINHIFHLEYLAARRSADPHQQHEICQHNADWNIAMMSGPNQTTRSKPNAEVDYWRKSESMSSCFRRLRKVPCKP